MRAPVRPTTFHEPNAPRTDKLALEQSTRRLPQENPRIHLRTTRGTIACDSSLAGWLGGYADQGLVQGKFMRVMSERPCLSQAGGAKNSSAIPSGSRKERPEP
jgi:hypothetical protein